MRLLLVLLLAAPAWAQDDGRERPVGGAGAVVTAGSRDYGALTVYGDAEWTRRDPAPYAKADLMSDDYQTALTLGGGVWAEIDPDVDGKAGLAFSTGRVKDADVPARSVALEFALERDFAGPVLGGDYRLTSGSLGNSQYARAGRGRLERDPRTPRARLRPDPYRSHELAGYARIPAGEGSIGLRLTLYVHSEIDDSVSETVSYWHPLNASLSASAAVTFEQSARDAVYVSAGIRHSY